MADGKGKGDFGYSDGKGKGKDEKGKGKEKGKDGKGKDGKGKDVKGVEPKSPYTTTDYTYAEADGSPLQIRVFRPDGAKGKATPCLICFQGSGFRGTDLERGAGTGMYYIDHGYTVVACPYRGHGDGIRFPTPLHECIAAIRYLRKNAAELGIDPNKIASYGGSSGGWSSLMLALSGTEKFKAAGLLGTVGSPELQAVSSTVCCAIDNFGPTDFAAMDKHAELSADQIRAHSEMEAQIHGENSPETKFLGVEKIVDNLELNARASPLTYIEPGIALPPLYVAHGDADPLVPVGQSRELVKKLQACGLQHEYTEIPKEVHGGAAFREEKTLQEVLRFLQKHCPA